MLYLEGRPYNRIDTSEDLVIHPAAEFNAVYDETWLDDSWSRRVISDIQRIDVTDATRSVREILRGHDMSPELLATGTKNLLLCKFAYDGRKCRMSMMGENCYKWLMDVADEKDICGVFTNVVPFLESDIQGRPIHFVNINVTVTNEWDFGTALLDVIAGGACNYAT